jgi:hypothetical protein
MLWRAGRQTGRLRARWLDASGNALHALRQTVS